MKKTILFSLALINVLLFTSCKKCEKCHQEMLGIKSNPMEFCGDELKKIKESGAWKCGDK